MNAPLSHIKKACLVFGTLFVLSLPIVWVSLFFTNYHGDLTRIGKWSEELFFPIKQQEKIEEKYLISQPIDQANVLVIGDSFSENLQWQSIFQRNEIKVATLLWKDISYICEDFSKKIEAAGFKGKLIIFQTIERGTAERIEKSLACKHTSQIKSESYSRHEIKHHLSNTYSMNINGKFITGLQTLINYLSIQITPNYSNFYNSLSKSARILAVKDGCELFSNNFCKYSLFLVNDFKQDALNLETLKKIKNFNQIFKQSHPNYQLVWAIIPNKSSIYLEKTTNIFWEQLKEQSLGPNLYDSFQESKKQIKDLYKPNDTHLSNDGYLLLGKELMNTKN
jgi:hypothetical protein